jgi:membrane protein DedA with SNARE-associated domain
MSDLSNHLPSALNAAAPAINHYGYLAIFGLILLEDFGLFFIPGESVLITAAFLAGAGKLNVFVVILAAIAGAVLGDSIGFAIGSLGGRRLIERWGKYVFITPERLNKAEAFFKRRGAKLVLFARFIDVFRQLNGILAGIGDMQWPTFLKYNSLGAVLWVAFWSAVGYFSGSHVGLILRYQLYLTITLVVAVVAYLFIRLIRRKHSRAG